MSMASAELGIERGIGAVIPYFTMAAPILAQTDLLLTVPCISLSHSAAMHGLEQRPVPFDLPELHLSLFRSAATGGEPGVRWFLDQLRQVSETLTR